MSPDVGPIAGGTIVTVDGTGFVDGSTSVVFGSTPATSITVDSPTELTVTAPPNAAGSVDIIVTRPSPGGTSTANPADLFAYGSPAVTGETPGAGPLAGGTVVTVTGTGFVPGAEVYFGLMPADASTVSVTSGTTLQVTAPAMGVAGSVDVSVMTPGPGGSSTTGTDDLFAYGAPTTALVAPDTGPADTATAVTITGDEFSPGDTVDFGATPATDVTVVSHDTITANSPATLDGGSNVTVTNAVGTSDPSVATQFAAGPPTVSAVTPSAGPEAGGGTVTVTGDGFVAGTSVKFGVTSSPTVTVTSPTSLTAALPAGAAGSVDVTVTTPAGTSATSPNDLYAYGAPKIWLLSRNTGPITGGTVVTVAGSGFVPSDVVSFGSAPGTNVSVNATGTSLQVTAPSNAAGTVEMTVTTSAGTSATSSVEDLFAYGPPVVTGVTPDAGAQSGGNTVTVAGSGFVPGVTVYFGTSTSTAVTVQPGGESLDAVAPANTAGPVDITVTSPQGTSATNPHDSYFYGSPAVTLITPASGGTAGGTAVTITGGAFSPDSTVTFGLTTATSVTVNSSTSITAVSPAGGEGIVPVRVSTPAGISPISAADNFEYSDQLEISCAPPPASTTSCDSIDLPAVNLKGEWQNATASANTLYVTDDRNDASVGWSLSAYLVPSSDNPNSWCETWSGFCNATAGSDSANPDAKIPADYFSVENVNCGPAAGNTNPSPSSGGGGDFPLSQGAVALCTAQAGLSAGTFVVNADFSLQIPPWIYAGQYQATVVFLVM